jgi:transposase
MKFATIELDIAKQVFQIHGADKIGRQVLRRKMRRSDLVRFFSELEPCLVGIEASGSAYYWLVSSVVPDTSFV